MPQHLAHRSYDFVFNVVSESNQLRAVIIFTDKGRYMMSNNRTPGDGSIRRGMVKKRASEFQNSEQSDYLFRMCLPVKPEIKFYLSEISVPE